MTKEKVRKLEIIYQQKQELCYWVEDKTTTMVKKAWDERTEAFAAWRDATNQLIKQQIQ